MQVSAGAGKYADDARAASGSTAAGGEQAEAARAKTESEQAEVVSQVKPEIEAAKDSPKSEATTPLTPAEKKDAEDAGAEAARMEPAKKESSETKTAKTEVNSLASRACTIVHCKRITLSLVYRQRRREMMRYVTSSRHSALPRREWWTA